MLYSLPYKVCHLVEFFNLSVAKFEIGSTSQQLESALFGRQTGFSCVTGRIKCRDYSDRGQQSSGSLVPAAEGSVALPKQLGAPHCASERPEHVEPDADDDNDVKGTELMIENDSQVHSREMSRRWSV